MKADNDIEKVLKDSTCTFIDNMSLPVHRWFRYPAGFSASWVEDVIKYYSSDIENKDTYVVLDPFAGSGTTLLAAEQMGVQGIGYESHPLVAKVARAKLLSRTDILEFKTFAYNIIRQAKTVNGSTQGYPDIVYKCYNDENLLKLDCLKRALHELNDNSDQYKLSWMAFISILRCSSHAGTASWQYVLPNKTKTKVADAFEAYERQIELMCFDMEEKHNISTYYPSKLFEHDARFEFTELENKVDLVITSPPYANNYDYADATRLELSVLGEIKGWGDLQTSIRTNLVRSCSQMVSKEKKKTFDFLKDPLLSPIYDEILDVCIRLDQEKELHGGKKNYHTMIALYFLDLANVWVSLRKACKDGANICFVIGDSAPYGIYVPVDEWLGRLAVSAGFKSYYFEKMRDRNVKWKNRKHRVPLKEGRLWVRG